MNLEFTFSNLDPINHLQGTLDKISKSFHRHLMVISGPEDWCFEQLEPLKATLLENTLVIPPRENVITSSVNGLTNKSLINSILGKEFSHVIYNGHTGFDPDLLGATSGTVTGGGTFFLLVPELDTWAEFNDPDNDKLTCWPHSRSEVSSNYLRRFVNLLVENHHISIISKQKGIRPGRIQLQSGGHSDSTNSMNSVVPSIPECRTEDQRHAVKAIIHTATGHRNRPTVLTSNRGRGKSTALGIAAAKLIEDRCKHIIITAPSLLSAEPCLSFAESLLPGFQRNKSVLQSASKIIEYMSPDEIIHNKPHCDILFVDEAAAIPVPLLEKLVDNYSRSVFSTTVHGYEGTGRGFALKFYKILDLKCPGWKQVELTTPIRWADNDPLEAFIFDALLLNTELAPVTSMVAGNGMQIRKFSQLELSQDPHYLSQLFSLLVYAHYQTHPRDLRFILDAFDLDIYAVLVGNNIIATAITQAEGQLPPELAQQIASNERRLLGHILPQIIESQTGFYGACKMKFKRIIRIAVHPLHQYKGIGSLLLSRIFDDAPAQQVDILGANFGATDELTTFWYKNDYMPIHLGTSRNATSGTQALTVLLGTSSSGTVLVNQLKDHFNNEFSRKLSTIYREVDSRLAFKLMRCGGMDEVISLSSREWENIRQFAHSNRELESVLLVLEAFYRQCFRINQLLTLLNDQEISLVIRRIFQFQDWKSIGNECGVNGKKQGVSAIRNVTAKIIDNDAFTRTLQITHK